MTGEVVTGTSERLATGDAVNVAARLQQAAQPGEIVIGERTLGLVRDAVAVEAVAPQLLRGKRDPVAAFRLLSLDTGMEAFPRHLEAPLVGRSREQQRLRAEFEAVVSEQSCHLVTLLGAAGVGKSRLVSEFLSGVDAQLVRGRCLSYGEGITYWAVIGSQAPMTASSMAWAFPVSRSATIIMCFAKRLGIENVSGNDRCRKSLESKDARMTT